uniref:Ig-like domain-containing protein n=1 Tax=Ciona savignyi TaxID=51511 RepID=H2YKF2_CIOSA
MVRVASRQRRGPMVVGQLHVELRLDGKVHIECSVSNPEEVKHVEWSKDGAAVRFSSGHMKSDAFGSCYALVINELFEEDAGSYECELVGTNGSSSTTSCTMSPQSCSSMRKKISKLAGSRASSNNQQSPMSGLMQHMERSIEQTTQITSFSSRASSTSSKDGTPKIEALPGSVSVNIGKVLTLTTGLSGQAPC